MSRIIDFADGFTSVTPPSIENISATNLPQYANDAEYEAEIDLVDGAIYYNTTSNKVRIYENGAWVENATFEA